jgi:hypothetical protein
MKTSTDPEIFARLRRLPPGVFTVAERLRDAAMARGVDVGSLSRGDAAPPRRVEASRDASPAPRMQRPLDPMGLPRARPRPERA